MAVEIEKFVYEPGRCLGCGGCVAICPYEGVVVKEFDSSLKGSPDYQMEARLVKENCTECRICREACPVLDGFPEDEFDNVKDSCAAKSSADGQDGGATSTILQSLLEKGTIDCAVVAGVDENGHSTAKIITTGEEVLQTAGSKYAMTSGAANLKEAVENYENVAIVGTPCQAQAARLLQDNMSDNIKVIISLFCSKSFTNYGLDKFVSEKFNTGLKRVKKMSFSKGTLTISADQEYTVSEAEIAKIGRKGCTTCMDFTGYHADISVGAIGSPAGWNTIIARTQNGQDMLAQVDGLETKDANLDPVKRFSQKKRDQNGKNFEPFTRFPMV